MTDHAPHRHGHPQSRQGAPATASPANAAALPALGFPAPVCVVVHPIFAEGSFRDLAAVTATDAVAHPSNALPLAPLIAAHLASLSPTP